jgi:hypothetical protein
MEENGGPNLYGFVLNNAQQLVDTDGRQMVDAIVRLGGELDIYVKPAVEVGEKPGLDSLIRGPYETEMGKIANSSLTKVPPPSPPSWLDQPLDFMPPVLGMPRPVTTSDPAGDYISTDEGT